MEPTQQVQNKKGFIRRKNLKNMLEHVTQEMYRRNFELAETNKTLSLLRQIDTLVLESQESLSILCEKICSSVALAADYPFVAILVHAPHHEGLELYGWATDKQIQHKAVPELDNIHVAADGAWLSSKERFYHLSLKTLSESKLAKMLDKPAADVTTLKQTFPLQAVHFVKLTARQRLVGVMAVGFLSDLKKLSPSDHALLERISEAVGVAIDNKLLVEENQRVVKELQQTNAKLKALDEAKDEFISMASHQLRTPLTSVKGYLSMVIEGDAGKLSAMQKKLLSQSFNSSQRMVYLIADLLNVSRLKTGKFIIEPVETNLADVVQGEIDQLGDSAKAKNLTLIYDKPKQFPKLKLDETKIRQVIMNFADNAIYYTPTGGTITVSLVNKPDTIEFTVTDNGIGVPKAEQHHLFSKFYRAGNARQARPDGTGLGLFMAKKVVIAQGGNLIFHSEEGKGSTFGFSFAKKKLAAQHLRSKSSFTTPLAK